MSRRAAPIKLESAVDSSVEDNLIEIKDLVFKRGDRLIFDELNMTVPRGQVTALMGPSGCGKTTLLRIIGGQLKPDSGTVLVRGEDVARLKRADLLELRKDIGMLFQTSALFTDMSVFENVAFPLREHTRLPEDTIRDLVLMKLNAVGLRGARDLLPSQLSGGMSRRVALARAIALDPCLLMYDEPFTGQDPIAMGVVVTLIRRLNTALDATSLLVSHDVHETASISDKIYMISEGKVVAGGKSSELETHESPRVRQFFTGSPDGPVPFHYPADRLEYDFLGDVSP
jgi:phospholipid/cholesterol/gamma-HCH transport system ATP-binding protein